eukprot:s164_g70.t1
MSFGDNEAVFTQRAREIGLDEAAVKCLIDEGIRTMALFAFSCNFSPGAADEKPFTDLIRKLLRRDPSTLEFSCMRRLFNESYANVASDIKARTEATDETPIRRLAPAERASRLKDQQQRLSGISISGQSVRTWRHLDRQVQSLLQPRPLSVAADKNKDIGPSAGEPPTKKPRRETLSKGKGKGGKNGAFVRIPHELLS